MTISGGIDKEDVIHYIQWNITQEFIEKSEMILFAATWMD